MNLKEIEMAFNEEVDFSNVLAKTTQYIKNTLLDSDNNFLSEDVTDGFYDFSSLRIEYDKTYVLIDEVENNNPFFRLKFYLYKPDEKLPSYTYEIEYNCNGEFSDEYFLKC